MSANVTEIESVNFKGYLEKQGRVKTWTWKKYWFLLEDGQLAYFLDDSQVEGRGLIDLGQALNIKSAPNTSRDYAFEIAVKNRNHVLCAETEELRDKWVRLLRQAKLLRPRRTPSMNIARCNSISSDEEGHSDFSSLDSLTTPPHTPKSPHTPTSPRTSFSPFFTSNKPTKLKPNSPKLAKNNAKLSSSPKLGGTAGNAAHNTALPVTLTSVKPIQNNFSSDQIDGGLIDSNSNRLYQQNKNETHYKKKIANSKTTISPMKSSKTPVSRVATSPTCENQHIVACKKSGSESGIVDNRIGGSETGSIRPVSSPGQLSRAKPVNKDLRPTITARPSGHRQPSTSSDDSDTPSTGPDVSKPKLERRKSGSHKKASIVPRESPGTGVVLRKARHARSTKSMPYYSYKDHSSDSDSDQNDSVFSLRDSRESSPRSQSIRSDEVLTMEKLDDCCERLTRSFREKKPPVKDLPYPRLELTFRSAFDDIRLFLANNRTGDEIFPVPRHSERGGKAIHNLQKCIDSLK